MTALLVAGLASLAPDLAAGATAPAASSFAAKPDSPFEVIQPTPPPQRSHRLFWTLSVTGAALVAASFPMAHSADQRYEAYLAETDPSQLNARFDATRRMDRLASASLWTGEAMLVSAVWLRFVRTHRDTDRVSLMVEPARCAVSLRF